MEERIIKYLEGLANGTIKPYDEEHGLCACLEEKGLKIPRLSQIFESWDKCSGNTIYPVPDPEGETDSCTKYRNTSDMWGGKYGELRKELCQFIADNVRDNGLPEDWED